jgi:hypothetical protein
MSDNGGLTDYRGMPQVFYRILDTCQNGFGGDEYSHSLLLNLCAPIRRMAEPIIRR